MSYVRLPLVTLRHDAAECSRSNTWLKDFLIRFFDRVCAWHDRGVERRRLLRLDERMLTDIGIDRATAIEEATKPFWRD